MTGAILMLLVPGTVVLALAIDLAAIIGWLRRRLEEEPLNGNQMPGASRFDDVYSGDLHPADAG